MEERSNALARRVLDTISRHAMIRPGDRLAAAVSGGADSVAMLHLLDDLHRGLGVRLIVVHCNHQLRGAESDADERFVAEFASRLELEILVVREDVKQLARRERRNLEEAARRWRLGVFRSLVEAGRVDRVALGHTADDQAETVLLRLLRGAGTRGLAGIYPVVEGYLVRPLLEMRRAELREFLRARGETWREDTSNRDLALLRNRIRHELLPELEKLAPAVVDRLAALADRARGEEAFWAAVIEPIFAEQARPESGGLSIPVMTLTTPPVWLGRTLGEEARAAVARRLIRRILEQVRGDLMRLTARHIDSVLHFAARPSSGHKLVLPGIVVERSFERLVFAREGAPPARGVYCYEVRVPGRVTVPEVGREFQFNLVDWQTLARRYNGSPPALDRSRIGPELIVRNWRAGDAYRPVGTARSRKVKELFQARRIPLVDRASWPVVLSGNEIVWVRGLPVAAELSVSEATREAILIEEKPL